MAHVAIRLLRSKPLVHFVGTDLQWLSRAADKNSSQSFLAMPPSPSPSGGLQPQLGRPVNWFLSPEARQHLPEVTMKGSQCSVEQHQLRSQWPLPFRRESSASGQAGESLTEAGDSYSCGQKALLTLKQAGARSM